MKSAPRWLMVLVLAIPASWSCDCDDRLRRMVRDQGDRKEQIEQAKKRRESGESSSPVEQEPNDVAEQATDIELGSDLRPIEAEIGSPADLDWFALTTADAQTWHIELTVTPADDELDLVIGLPAAGSDGSMIEYDLGGPGESESIPVLSVSAEPRLFVVSSKDNSRGAYEISTRKRLSGGSIAAEPNDDVDTATVFEAPGEIQGMYDRPGDRDIFYVSRAELEGEVFNLEVSPIGGLVQRVEVFTQRGFDSPYVSFQVPPDQSAGIPNLGLPKELTGLWIVLSADDAYDRSRSYRLKLLGHPPAEHDIEAEPNDSVEQAQALEIGARLAGYFHRAEDVDVFRIAAADAGDAEAPEDRSADAGGQASAAGAGQSDAGAEKSADADPADRRPADPLEAVADKQAPAQMVRVSAEPVREETRLAMSWGQAEVSGRVIEAREPGEVVTLCNRAIAEGAIEVELRPIELSKAGLQTGYDYRLVVQDVGQHDGLEVEPNDTREQADKLSAQTPRVGYIAQSGDVDVYAFSVPYPVDASDEGDEQEGSAARREGPRLGWPTRRPAVQPATRSVELTLGANPLNLSFELYDDEGGRIATVNRSGAGAAERLRIDLPSGLYFVHVSAERGASCEPYMLEIKQQE